MRRRDFLKLVPGTVVLLGIVPLPGWECRKHDWDVRFRCLYCGMTRFDAISDRREHCHGLCRKKPTEIAPLFFGSDP